KRDGVVPDRGVLRPASGFEQGSEPCFFGRGVHTGEHQRRCVEQRPIAADVVEQLLQDVEAALVAETVRRAPRASNVGEQHAVLARERQLGLRVAAVDTEHGSHACSLAKRGRWGAPASSKRSASSLIVSHWPTSGCASSAERTSPGSPESAARTASRSYALTCCTSPSSSGASGRCGNAVKRPSRNCAGISTTSSFAR